METGTPVKDINNAFYEDLGDRWYEAWDDPVALLRQQGNLKNPWVANLIHQDYPHRSASVLDIGCGAGFLSNELSNNGHRVTGVDMSPGSLKVARIHDTSRNAVYGVADAYRLPFRDGSLDAVTCMDFLEHVDAPGRVIAEASRVLKPGGLFFFHTFNRNVLAWLVIIKGVEWFVRNTPRHMHVLPLFIKPTELVGYCRVHMLEVKEMRGIRPKILSSAFWKMLMTRRVSKDFHFCFTPSLTLSYLGYARKAQPTESKAPATFSPTQLV